MTIIQLQFRVFVIGVLSLLVVVSGGCVATIKRPKAVELRNSTAPGFPYKIEIPANEVTRYNVHQFKPEFSDQKVFHYLFLKRNLGQLKEGEYAFSYYLDSLSTASKSRGLVTITDSEITIEIEIGLEESPGDRAIQKYVPCEFNGRYRIGAK